VNGSGKHFSLLRYSNNYSGKKFALQIPGLLNSVIYTTHSQTAVCKKCPAILKHSSIFCQIFNFLLLDLSQSKESLVIIIKVFSCHDIPPIILL
jgi:hypothetical protein